MNHVILQANLHELEANNDARTESSSGSRPAAAAAGTASGSELLFSIDENPPWYLAVALGFQVTNTTQCLDRQGRRGRGAGWATAPPIFKKRQIFGNIRLSSEINISI